MKLLSAPRQPFVGLAGMAGLGIILADFFPLASSALVGTALIILLCAFVFLGWPRLTATYAVVGAGFFLLHGLRTSNTEGQRLAAELGSSPRVVTATGSVLSEPKIAPNGFATFLLKLESIELEGRRKPTHAVWQVRWRGNPEFGDELRLFGKAEVIARLPEIQVNSICFLIVMDGGMCSKNQNGWMLQAVFISDVFSC